MNISLPKKSHRLVFFVLFSFSAISFADGLSTKSMLVALSIPAIGGVYSFTSGDYEGLKELTLASLVTAQITTLLKNSVHRTRPNGGNDDSFPSGHASASFVGASFLHHRYGIRWGLPMYALASVISYERVNAKDHFWSDVIAGAVIGYTAGAYFTVRYPNVWIVPQFEPQNKVVGVQIRTRY